MDLELTESGNGGELIKNKKDLSVIFGFENFPYLSMFGGNVEESTPVTRFDGQQALDYWGNTLLMPEDSKIQFNSLTERMLKTTPLTSQGRVLIENAIKEDLQAMSDFANVIVKVEIVATDKIVIGIRLLQPDNIQRKDFIYIWDATNFELMDRALMKVDRSTVVTRKIFDFSFDFSLE